METEKSNNLSEQRVDLLQEKGSETSSDKNIYWSNPYRKDLSWPHFDDEPRVQEKQQVKDQHSCLFVFVAYLTIPSSN